MTILEVEELTVRFGGVLALDRLSFRVQEQHVCALIGPNGAGKTTAFNAISGLVRPSSGRVRFDGLTLNELRPDQMAAVGITRTFQNLALWRGLSVLENVMVGAHHRGRQRMLTAMVRWGLSREESQLRDIALAALADLGIDDLADAACDELPYGTMKRVELARAVAGRPRLLMLDEPASGLTQSEVAELGELIVGIRDRYAVTVVIVEHHMQMVMSIADHVVGLDRGQRLVEGPPMYVREDPRLIDAYLGPAHV